MLSISTFSQILLAKSIEFAHLPTTIDSSRLLTLWQARLPYGEIRVEALGHLLCMIRYKLCFRAFQAPRTDNYICHFYPLIVCY